MKNTKELIAKSLNALLQNHSLEEITISLICENSKLSRATFYRHYHDKYEVLNYIFHHFISPLIFNDKLSYQELSTKAIIYARQNYQYFMNIINDENNVFIKLLFNKYIQYLGKNMPPLTTTQYNVLVIYLHGTILSAVSWFRKGVNKSPQELIELFQLAMPSILQDSFNQ